MIGAPTVEAIRAAMALPDFDAVAAQELMAPQPRPLRRSPSTPGQPRLASTLILLYPGEEGLSLVLTRRAEHPHDVHSGQISLPGGSQEPGETPLQTALREANEEVGFADDAEILGTLTPIYIPPSDFRVVPVVVYAAAHPAWTIDPVEVAAVIECPVTDLLDDRLKVVEDWDLRGYRMRVPWYNIQGNRVWGATAIILSELEQRLRAALEVPHAVSRQAGD
ncbi:NUDIX hydrolase [Aggregatilinea lenta]|uniref:NUDIX hydrolase n=1 Tax=Aggregatilinea lenta TaxID=913108 RepID=UPI000E5B3F53|nr:CoA pyrophosphatase [Aggregatilinea lenta]